MEFKKINSSAIVVLLLIFAVIGFVVVAEYNRSQGVKQSEIKKRKLEKKQLSENSRPLYIASSAEGKYLLEKNNDTYFLRYFAENFQVLGDYNDSLYMYDDNHIFSFSLNNPNLDYVEWGRLEENNFLSQAFIYDNYIYFKYKEIEDETKKGLLRIPITEQNFNSTEQIISNISDKQWIYHNDILYYIDSEESSLYSYTLETNENKKIMPNITDFTMFGDKIIYLQKNNEESTLGIYSLNNNSSHEIDTINADTMDGNVYYENNSIYYKKDNNILYYSNGNKDTYIDPEELSLPDEAYNFAFLNPSSVELSYIDGASKYIVEGEVKDSYNNQSINVTSPEGETKELSIIDIELLT